MKIKDLAGLEDKTQIESITLNIVSIDKVSKQQYGTSYNCTVRDETGKTYATFSGQKKHDVNAFLGKQVKLTSYRNKDGELKSIRVDKKGNYANLWITDSVIVETIADAPAQTSQPQVQHSQSRPTIPSPLAAKRMAEEWCAVYSWTKDVFKTVLSDEQLPERVTGIYIQLRNNGYEILPPIKLNWKDVVYRDTKLGDLGVDRIRKALVKIYQGVVFPTHVKDALLEAAKEDEHSAVNCLQQLLNDSDVDPVIAGDVFTEKGLDITNQDDILKAIADKDFIESCKKKQASQPSPIDDVEI